MGPWTLDGPQLSSAEFGPECRLGFLFRGDIRWCMLALHTLALPVRWRLRRLARPRSGEAQLLTEPIMSPTISPTLRRACGPSVPTAARSGAFCPAPLRGAAAPSPALPAPRGVAACAEKKAPGWMRFLPGDLTVKSAPIAVSDTYRALEGCEVFVPDQEGLERRGQKVELVQEWSDDETVVLAFGRSFG